MRSLSLTLLCKTRPIPFSQNQHLESDDGIDLLEIFTILEQDLQAFKNQLTLEDLEEAVKSARKICIFCDQIFIFCAIYLDLVHPVWISQKRDIRGEFSNDVIEERKSRLMAKLEQNQNRFLTEFSKYQREEEEA